jgi:hypothetical protein
MYVVLDTNQWDTMPMLRHRLAAPLLFAAQSRRGVHIALPTVVKREVELHLVERVEQAQASLKKASGQIRQVFGRARQVEEHSAEEVRQAFEQRLADLGQLVQIFDPTDEDLVRAGRMVLDYAPPSTRGSQQYRDSVIWQIVMHWSRDSDVYLVTADGGFYAGKESSEMAEALAREVHENRRSVRLFRSVEALLKEWGRTRPDLAAELRDPVADAVEAELAEALAHNSEFEVGRRTSAEIEVYLTEGHDPFRVSGRFTFLLSRPGRPGGFAYPARAEVGATATVGIADHKVRDAELGNVEIETVTGDGARSVSNMVFGRAALAVVGPPAEPYRLTVNFDEGWPGSADDGG